MPSRTDLQSILEAVLGKTNVYFQPPESVKMVYPCIRYEWESSHDRFANGLLYFHKRRYRVIIMDTNPDSPIPERLARLPMCKFDRHYVSNNLHHFSFNLYY